MLATPKKVLVLAPHPDDGEFGCGASVARFINEGAEVYYATFSLCETSLPDGYAEEHLREELNAAMQELGVSEKNVIVRKYPVRRYPQYRQEILENILEDQKAISPDLVFLPSRSDIHQDHKVIAEEGLRVYKHTSMLAYELPWNTIEFKTTLLLRISEEQLDKKLRALACYKSQVNRTYFQENFVRSLARVRGVQAAHQFAEAFEVPRIVT